MEMVKTKEAVYDYLIEPSHLFLKQVVEVAETKSYILVMDIRILSKRSIPDVVISHFENRFQHLCQLGYRCQHYDGVNYLLIQKNIGSLP
jgi:hypothetical protein